MAYSPGGRALTPPITEADQEWNKYYGDRIEDALEKRQRAMEDMQREVDRETEGHVEVMNKEWEIYRLAIDKEMSR